MAVVNIRSRKVPILAEKEILVLGGGPAGVAAAVAAARNGADVGLVERYGHLGGMATGGLVIILMRFDASGEQVFFGIAAEVLERLANLGATYGPPKSVWGSMDPEHVEYWKEWGATQYRIEENQDEWLDTKVRNRISFDPESLKYICNEMLMESGVELWLHSWIGSVVIEDNIVKGVIIESKSGPKAIMGKVLIDGTGDGDIMAGAGAEFDKGDRPLALPFRFGNVDIPKARTYIRENRDEYKLKMAKLKKQNGFWQERFFNTVHPNVIWFSNIFPNRDALNIEDLTAVEVEGRRKIITTLQFYRKNIPGFESAFLLDTASQIGIRESRKLVGEYVITRDDVKSKQTFKDVVAKGISYFDYDLVFDIPYRSLLPKNVEGLIVGGRPISMTHQAFTWTQALIVQCIATGEAAGTAAALSVRGNIPPRRVDIKVLQKTLKEGGVIL